MVFPQGVLDKLRRRRKILDQHDAPAGAVVRRRAGERIANPEL
jgi:hypothetical protein